MKRKRNAKSSPARIEVPRGVEVPGEMTAEEFRRTVLGMTDDEEAATPATRARRITAKDEARIQRAVIQRMMLAGWLVIRFNSGVMPMTNAHGEKRVFRAYQIINAVLRWAFSGLPDVICFKGHRFVMAEVKTATGRLRKSQVYFHSLARAFGIDVEIWRSLDDCERWLEFNAG
jgi:hypothetical protein